MSFVDRQWGTLNISYISLFKADKISTTQEYVMRITVENIAYACQLLVQSTVASVTG